MLEIRDMVAEQTIYTFWAEGPINITAGVSLPGVLLAWLQFPEITVTHSDMIHLQRHTKILRRLY